MGEHGKQGENGKILGTRVKQVKRVRDAARVSNSQLPGRQMTEKDLQKILSQTSQLIELIGLGTDLV